MKSAFLIILYLALFCTPAHSQWEVKYVDTDFPGSLHVIKAINDSTLFDATGRKVMVQQMCGGALQIPAAHLPKGPYFLYARSADGAKAVQLIKM